MISFDKIWVFSATILGFVIIFSEADILISRNLTKQEKYKMELEITKHIDRFYNLFRKAELWNVYEDTVVRSKFEFFIKEDDNVKELIHYMEFIRTSGAFFDSLSLSYSILYTKYKAAFYAINILNIYKIKRLEFESLDENKPMNVVLKNHRKKIFHAYLKVGQYLAWYALVGNDFLLDEIENKLSKKVPCAGTSYTEFRKSFENILGKIDTKIFQTTDPDVEKKPDSPIDLDKFWTDIFKTSTQDIQIINRYFATIFSGSKEGNIEIEEFIETFKKELFIAKFVSDLSVMKGRDIEETFSNFDTDNEHKKELYESNITHMMMVIENEEMKNSVQDGGMTQQMNARKNEQYLILQPSEEDELFTCLRFEFIDHEVVREEDISESQLSTDEE